MSILHHLEALVEDLMARSRLVLPSISCKPLVSVESAEQGRSTALVGPLPWAIDGGVMEMGQAPTEFQIKHEFVNIDTGTKLTELIQIAAKKSRFSIVEREPERLFRLLLTLLLFLLLLGFIMIRVKRPFHLSQSTPEIEVGPSSAGELKVDTSIFSFPEVEGVPVVNIPMGCDKPLRERMMWPYRAHVKKSIPYQRVLPRSFLRLLLPSCQWGPEGPRGVEVTHVITVHSPARIRPYMACRVCFGEVRSLFDQSITVRPKPQRIDLVNGSDEPATTLAELLGLELEMAFAFPSADEPVTTLTDARRPELGGGEGSVGIREPVCVCVGGAERRRRR